MGVVLINFNKLFTFLGYKNEIVFVNLKKLEYLNKFLKIIKYSMNLLLDLLVDIFVTDYLYFIKRFRVCHNFSSNFKYFVLFINFSIRLLQSYVSINNLYKSCIWIEREVYDMFGIKFINNWDLRKILTDYTFFGFPLRKDFPLSGFLELMYDIKKKITIETLIEFMQEMRFFSMPSPIEFWDLLSSEEN